MSFQRIGILAALGSLALLAGALAFQYLGGLPPCKMCIWQRWPHGLAVLCGLALMIAPIRAMTLIGAGAAFVTSGIGLFHAGVEQGWWEGPTTCTSGPIDSLSGEELLNQILSAPVVRCDEIAWSLAGISMAGWNALLSFGLALVWCWAVKRAYASSSASQ